MDGSDMEVLSPYVLKECLKPHAIPSWTLPFTRIARKDSQRLCDGQTTH